MLLDATELDPGTLLQADICIVGAGAAGITLALQFADTQTQVLLLEAGGWDEEPATQALYDGELAPATRHPPPIRYRRRQFGGSTAIWGGRCVPFDPIDFEPRAWVPHSGWPIPYEQVARHYGQAAALCEAGDAHFHAARDWPDILHGFAGADFSADTLERFSCPTNFARRYAARLRAAANIRVVLHANVTQIRTGQDGAAVTGLAAASLATASMAGRRFEVGAETYVLAAGGLETTRLLLARSDQHPAGIGNAHDQLGRFYMCHLAGTLGALRPHVAVHHGYTLAEDGAYCRRRLTLRPDAQRRLRTGNFTARLHHPRIGDPSHRSGALSALYLAAPLITPEYATRLQDGGRGLATYLGHAGNIARAPVQTARFMLHLLGRRMLADRKFPSIIVAPPSGCFSLDVHAEQLPNPDSRVTLGAGTDALGMPPLRVDWRHLPADIDTVRLALRALAADLARTGAATLDYDEDAVEELMLRDGAYGGHHIGTARMSASPRDGVVDGDCLVHGMRNLFVAGSAVFPTSGQANPTLTIVALALRLAKHMQGSKRFFFEKKNQKTFGSAVAES